MTLQSSGLLKYSDIASEFGSPPNNNIGAYRVSKTYGQLTNLPLDSGIPQSGQIKFSDFYNKRANVIIDLYSSTIPLYRQNARSNYNDSSTVVVGEFKSPPPANDGNIKVFIHVNSEIGSISGDTNYVALRTGSSWGSETQMYIDVGTSGKIYGAGGSGGKGGNTLSGDGQPGISGSSALGIEYTGSQSGGTSVRLLGNGSRIQCGYGGGGGGGAAYNDPDKNTRDYAASGGGGGGGAGLPAGTGGVAGDAKGGNKLGVDKGEPGSDGTLTVGGGGGAGGDKGGADAGAGGRGGGVLLGNAANGQRGDGNVSEGKGGAGGATGAAIRKASGVTFTLNVGIGTVIGITTAIGVL